MSLNNKQEDLSRQIMGFAEELNIDVFSFIEIAGAASMYAIKDGLGPTLSTDGNIGQAAELTEKILSEAQDFLKNDEGCPTVVELLCICQLAAITGAKFKKLLSDIPNGKE